MRESGPGQGCVHGGAFFEAIGDGFERLDRCRQVISADVLDAWFPPAPGVLAALGEHLPWLVRTSPPIGCEGLVRAISRARGVPIECLLPGAGSSQLIYLALSRWLTPASRALVLDPTYGEYAHLLRRVLGCRVERLELRRREHYALDPERLARCLASRPDLVVLVNPNSPTGQHLHREALEQVLGTLPSRSLVWIDETYVDYAGPEQSLEPFAARSERVVVCKSMSKAYALSGLRVAYLCGPSRLMASLRAWMPPWAVGLPAQVAAVQALQDPGYYAARWQETHSLRRQLGSELQARAGLDVLQGCANFVLCHLPSAGPSAAEITAACRESDLFLRDLSDLGPTLGSHALRIAVKDARTNRRIVDLLSRVLSLAGAARECGPACC